MRIALVITELNPGGAETCLTELALHLTKQGHDVRVWALGPPPSPPRDVLVARLSAAGVEVRFRNATSTLSVWPAMRWLRAELNAFGADAVQSMLWHANVLSAFALGRSSCPLFGGIRVSEPRRVRWFIERDCARRMQKVVCVSNDVYRHALHNERLPAEKLLVIPNGVRDDLLIPPVSAGELPARFKSPGNVFLFVGRLEAQKGVVPLVEHVPQILAGRPDWSLAMLGSGSLRSKLEAVVARERLESKVELLGWQPDADRWMRASEVVLLPAVYEGMPNVLLEAMALCKPFVAFAVDGVRELVLSSAGYPADLARAQLAAPGNWNEFVLRAQALASDAKLRTRCGSANRRHVAQHFRLGDQLQKYLTMYEAAQSSGR